VITMRKSYTCADTYNVRAIFADMHSCVCVCVTILSMRACVILIVLTTRIAHIYAGIYICRHLYRIYMQAYIYHRHVSCAICRHSRHVACAIDTCIMRYKHMSIYHVMRYRHAYLDGIHVCKCGMHVCTTSSRRKCGMQTVYMSVCIPHLHVCTTSSRRLLDGIHVCMHTAFADVYRICRQVCMSVARTAFADRYAFADMYTV